MRAVGLVVVLAAGVAHANPAAEKLFQDGRAFMTANKLPEACDAFRRSHDLWPRYATLMNFADCEAKRGRIVTAWAAFVQARRLANQKADKHVADREAEADKRAAALLPKLPQLTVRTPAVKPAGLIVKRDGKELPDAELDHELPIDPGSYELEATAPGHVTWKQTTVVTIGKQTVVEIPALAADPAAAPPATIPSAATTTATAPATGIEPASVDTGVRPSIEAPTMLTGKHRIGAGAAVGLTTESDVIYGVRIPVQLAPVGTGAIRAVPSAFYASFKDPDDVYHEIKLYALGLGLEYVHPLAPTFFVAGGIGVGVDLIDDNYGDSGISRQAWGALRLSPTFRLGKAIDIGLHLQVVKTDDNTVGLGELGLDYFFY